MRKPPNTKWLDVVPSGSVKGMDQRQHTQSGSQMPQHHRIAPAKCPPGYFWGEDGQNVPEKIHDGYREARGLIQDGSLGVLESLSEAAMLRITEAFDCLKSPDGTSKGSLVKLRLSDDLEQWRREQHALGRILPSKGHGLGSVSKEALALLGAQTWPEPLVQNNTLFISGMANMLIGASDAEALYTNYCLDVAFFYEHGYHQVFPGFEDLVQAQLHTAGGSERKAAVNIGMRYIRAKVALEEAHKEQVSDMTAKLDRRSAQIVFFLESSILGMGREAIMRGFDRAAVMSDLIFSSPGTDVIDVGSDLYNCELWNSFLNTADITSTGVVAEEALRKVYDAYAHTGARMLCERWSEPAARLSAMLYPWHMVNDRHRFLRRALLGFPKARKGAAQPREADFDEAFDMELRTTGFSRSLKEACSGGEPCDRVEGFLGAHDRGEGVLAELWWSLVTGPVRYVARGVVGPAEEEDLAERLRLSMARSYSHGLVDEMTWLIAHASHHAWQVNRLFEAAMFGSLLDDGGLRGKLDRKEY
ncbi:hypothetical protein VB005_07685 [Metarhizium brunneum]